MKRIIPLTTVLILLVVILLVLKPRNNNDLTLYIASSTTEILEEISGLYEKETGVHININPASSGVLAKQIKSGANPDIFISASKKWIDYLIDDIKKVDSFVENSLVLITPINSKLETFSLDSDFNNYFNGRISIGDPEHVPAGAYAKEVLEYYNWYESIINRILPGANVRAALSVVEMGESDLGIVYKTDALKSKKVKIIYTFNNQSHSPIKYYCAMLNSNKKETKAFYDFLVNSKQAKEIYRKYGF